MGEVGMLLRTAENQISRIIGLFKKNQLKDAELALCFVGQTHVALHSAKRALMRNTKDIRNPTYVAELLWLMMTLSAMEDTILASLQIEERPVNLGDVLNIVDLKDLLARMDQVPPTHVCGFCVHLPWEYIQLCLWLMIEIVGGTDEPSRFGTLFLTGGTHLDHRECQLTDLYTASTSVLRPVDTAKLVSSLAEDKLKGLSSLASTCRVVMSLVDNQFFYNNILNILASPDVEIHNGIVCPITVLYVLKSSVEAHFRTVACCQYKESLAQLPKEGSSSTRSKSAASISTSTMPPKKRHKTEQTKH